MVVVPLCISIELIYKIGTFSFHDGILMVLRSLDISEASIKCHGTLFSFLNIL